METILNIIMGVMFVTWALVMAAACAVIWWLAFLVARDGALAVLKRLRGR